LASKTGKASERLGKGRSLNTQGLATVIVFVLIFIFLSIASPSFLTVTNLIGLVRQVALLCIVAVGMTFLIIAGGIDLSVGSANAVTGVLCALVVTKMGFPTPLGVLTGVVAGGLIGLANGLLVTRINLPPLLATLGMMVALRGGAFSSRAATRSTGCRRNTSGWAGATCTGWSPSTCSS